MLTSNLCFLSFLLAVAVFDFLILDTVDIPSFKKPIRRLNEKKRSNSYGKKDVSKTILKINNYLELIFARNFQVQLEFHL